ncbi:MAG: T9SS type A sorting domain-containing protein [Calditrichaeota bacterium]|nr:T9SS type A sorting domain-containing protein [Calditrichota bacterium]
MILTGTCILIGLHPVWGQNSLSVSEIERPEARPHSKSVSRIYSDQTVVPIDVKKYDLFLEPNPFTGFLSGRCELTFTLINEPPDDAIPLNLVHLTVDSVTSASGRWQFSQNDSLLFLKLPSNPVYDDTQSVVIYYHGYPSNDGFGGYFASNQMVWTVGEGLYTYPPSMARRWIPSVDQPVDKALLRMRVRVPNGFRVGSNGLLRQIKTNPDGTTDFIWEEDFPIATYLISIGAARFAEFHQTFVTAAGDSIPILHFVYPKDSAAAVVDVQHLPDMMKFFSEKFGPYPFKKYGMLEAPMRGAMEHQTLTTMSDLLYTGDRRYEGVIAHELAHQWWGDCVTLADWQEIWLNEGFATYSDALYTEHAYGEKAFKEKMDRFAARYFKEDDTVGRFPIYNPEKMWGATVYEKGAWVLHMLRGVVGDSVFFNILKTYHRTFAYGNTTIADFQHVAESVSGRDLKWFFNEWLLKAGYPVFRFQWQALPTSSGRVRVKLRLEQIQVQAPVFKMPVQIQFEFEDSTRVQTIWVDQVQQEFDFAFGTAPGRVVFDPNHWVLKKLYDLSTLHPPEEFRLLQSYPNPFYGGDGAQNMTLVFWTKSGAGTYNVNLTIYDALGRKVRTLADGKLPPGYHRTYWDVKDTRGTPVPTGIYFCVLTQGSETRVQKIVVIR